MLKKLFMSTVLCALSGCSIFATHHMPTQQGNELQAQDIASITIGMNQEQVKAILGEPLLTKAYQNQQLNYVYTLQENGGVIQERHLILDLKDEKVSKITEKAYPEKPSS